jgi:hypothetical protein
MTPFTQVSAPKSKPDEDFTMPQNGVKAKQPPLELVPLCRIYRLNSTSTATHATVSCGTDYSAAAITGMNENHCNF